jgi:hypothetical protein
MSSLRDPIASLPARRRGQVSATTALSAVAMTAAIWFAFTPRPGANVPASDFRPAPAIKMIGGAPRGAGCEQQTWPFIEERCLRRTATAPRSTESAKTESLQETKQSTAAQPARGSANADLTNQNLAAATVRLPRPQVDADNVAVVAPPPVPRRRDDPAQQFAREMRRFFYFSFRF